MNQTDKGPLIGYASTSVRISQLDQVCNRLACLNDHLTYSVEPSIHALKYIQSISYHLSFGTTVTTSELIFPMH